MFQGKFQKLYRSIISQARKPGLVYKETQVKASLDAVAVDVPAPYRAKLQVLAKGIQTYRSLIAEYTAKEQQLSTQAREYAKEFFDEKDKVLTRTLVLQESMIRFTKVVPKIKKEQIRDAAKLEKLVKEIGLLLQGQQTDIARQIKAMISNCDYLIEREKETIPKEKVLVDPNVVSEGVVANVINAIKKKIAAFVTRITEFVARFDEKQDLIKEKLAQARAIK